MSIFNMSEVDTDNGFDNDLFQRKDFGEKLFRITKLFEQSGVILLDAPWGSGKTVFIKQWCSELNKQNISSIYFDAFANDYQDDAFLTIASQIIERFDDSRLETKKFVIDFKDKALQAAKVLGRASLKIGIHAATAGLVDSQVVGEIMASAVKEAGNEAANSIDEALKKRLESSKADRDTFDGFRKALEGLAASSSNEENKAPLIFIIDELDRCRPTFALEILEKIKHFYAVPGVVFVLVSNLPQLEAVVTYSYGNVDAHTYLEKFYHLRVVFPMNAESMPHSLVKTYLNHQNCDNDSSNIIDEFSKIQPISFRTLERIVAYIKICRESVRSGLFHPPIISILSILKVMKPSLYEQAREAKLVYSDFEDYFQFTKWFVNSGANQRSGIGEHCENWIKYCLGMEIDVLKQQSFDNHFFYLSLSTNQIIPYFCNLIDGFSLPEAKSNPPP